MAVTFTPATNPASKGRGIYNMSVGDLALDNSYPTGGYAITPSNLGFARIFSLVAAVAAASGNFLNTVYNPVTEKLMVFYPTGGSTASPAAVAQPRSSAGALAATAVDATQPNITPGAGKEVLATTDLSAFTVRVIAIGQ